MENWIVQLVLLAPPIFLAMTFHEYAHARVALMLGDPTAKLMGRLTLNPLKHIDPLGLLLLFLVRLGWARPVPVNPAHFKHPFRDMMWVALAGPATNLVLAFLGVPLYRWMAQIPAFHSGWLAPLLPMTQLFVLINVIFALFNLLPLPPLDGWRILQGVFPQTRNMHQFEVVGPLLIFLLVIVGGQVGLDLFGLYIDPFVRIFLNLLQG